MNSNDKYDWDFKCLNAFDCSLELVYHTTNKLFSMIFKKTVNRKSIKASINDVPDMFYIDPRFFKLMNNLVNREVKHVLGNVLTDGVLVVGDMGIKSAYFKKNNDKWDIFISLRGVYTTCKKKDLEEEEEE